MTVQEFEFDKFKDTDYVIIGEIEWEYYSLSNGKCGLEITIYGDYLVYLEYSLVGKYTGTVIDFSDDLYNHSNQDTNYNYDYFFVSEIVNTNDICTSGIDFFKQHCVVRCDDQLSINFIF